MTYREIAMRQIWWTDSPRLAIIIIILFKNRKGRSAAPQKKTYDPKQTPPRNCQILFILSDPVPEQHPATNS